MPASFFGVMEQTTKTVGAIAGISEGILEMADRLIGEGAEAMIGGYTEIPLVLSQDRLAVSLVASTEALAATTVAYALGHATLPHIH